VGAFCNFALGAFLFSLHSAVFQVSKSPKTNRNLNIFVLIGIVRCRLSADWNRPAPYRCIWLQCLYPISSVTATTANLPHPQSSDMKKLVKISIRHMWILTSKICRIWMWMQMPLSEHLFYQSECNAPVCVN